MSILIKVFPSDKTTKGAVIRKLSELRYIQSTDNVFTINSIIDLEGVKIEMPKNAELNFKNGTIKNGIIKLNNNKLSGDVNIIGCHLEGTVSNDVINMSWFKYNKNTFEDINQYIQELIDLSKGKELLFDKDGYYEILIKESNNKILNDYKYAFLLDNSYNRTTLNLNNSTIKVNPNGFENYSAIILFNTLGITIKNGIIKGEINKDLDKQYICEDIGINCINSINTDLDNLDITLFNFKAINTDLKGKEIYKFNLVPGIINDNGIFQENQSGFTSSKSIDKEWLLSNIEQYKISNNIKDNIDSINWIILPEGFEESYEKINQKLLFTFFDSEGLIIERREFNLWGGLKFYAWNEFPAGTMSFKITLSDYEELPRYSSLKIYVGCQLNTNVTIEDCKIYNCNNSGLSINYANSVNVLNSKFINIYNGINNETGINLNLIINNCDFRNLTEGLNLSTLYTNIINSKFINDNERMIINAIYSFNEIMNYLVIDKSIFTNVEFNNAGHVELNNSDFTGSLITMGNNGDKYYFRASKTSMGWWKAVKNPISDLNMWFELIECSFMRELSKDDYNYDWFKCPYYKIIR